MVFSSTEFMFVFLPLVLLLYYNPIFKGRRFRNIVLLLASLGFYAWGEPVFVIIMCASIVLNWYFCIVMDSKEGTARKRCMLFLAVYDLGLLFIFKYVSFLSRNLGILIHNDSVVLNIALPIGISFFVFEMMSYMYDVYYGSCKAQKSLINVALYISMFPQLVAGPIVRYSVVSEDIETRIENMDDFNEGVYRFIYGLGKKVIISNNIAIVADWAFTLVKTGELTTGMAYVGALAYMIQLYFDFSGYSDMAIGLGRMFGFRFDENFNYPYMSQSIPEYWRRWHISLGLWFKDYVMYPVMRTKSIENVREKALKKWGRQASKILPTVVGTAVVWLLEGIWHGANWTFVIFGIYHGTLVILSTIFRKKIKAFDDKYQLDSKRYVKVLRVIKTMFLVMIADIMFRADSLTDAIHYYGVMLGIGNSHIGNHAGFFLWNYRYLFIFGVIGCFPVINAIKASKLNKNVVAVLEMVFMLLILVISLSYLVRGSYNPFVYFNF